MSEKIEKAEETEETEEVAEKAVKKESIKYILSFPNESLDG